MKNVGRTHSAYGNGRLVSGILQPVPVKMFEIHKKDSGDRNEISTAAGCRIVRVCRAAYL
jgi:hypothetical protein